MWVRQQAMLKPNNYTESCMINEADGFMISSRMNGETPCLIRTGGATIRARSRKTFQELVLEVNTVHLTDLNMDFLDRGRGSALKPEAEDTCRGRC